MGDRRSMMDSQGPGRGGPGGYEGRAGGDLFSRRDGGGPPKLGYVFRPKTICAVSRFSCFLR